MGLSILIPVYNYPVLELVSELHVQLTRAGREGEIIVFDDGSSTKFKEQLQELEKIGYIRLLSEAKNQGRMAARLRLAELAKFDFLLFLDADSKIVQPDFISRYFERVDQGIALACGGRIYSHSSPPECEYRLHWKYGTERESRVRNPDAAFMSNNFLIRKDLFNKLDRSIVLKEYGHEDSWWGIQFYALGITCQYFNNAVLHNSLQDSEQYLKKSVDALNNIFVLEKTVDKNVLQKHIKIYRAFIKLKKMGLLRLYLFLEKPFHRRYYKNLVSCKPSLFYFDNYRLAELIRIYKAGHSV